MKYSKEGIKIPLRCKFCGSRKTMLSTYKTGEKFIECEGCWTVIRQVMPSEWRMKKKLKNNISNGKIK
jgi:uncharacterized Zn finger protein